MKKFLAAVLTAMLALSMTACGSEEEETSSDYTPPSNITIYVESGDTAVPVDVDVSNMTNPFAYITMIIDLPKGFVADQQTATLTLTGYDDQKFRMLYLCKHRFNR